MIRRLMVAALLMVTVAACGGAGDDFGVASAGGDAAATTSADAGEDLTDEERTLKFAECMRENGVEMSDPDGDGPPMIEEGADTSLAEVEAAHEKCKQYAPSGGAAPGEADPEHAERMREVAQCMRDNGFPDFPDPDEDGRVVLGEETGIDPTDEKFQEAQAKCDTNAPTGAPNRRPTS